LTSAGSFGAAFALALAALVSFANRRPLGPPAAAGSNFGAETGPSFRRMK
jgi:hypothetical protein